MKAIAAFKDNRGKVEVKVSEDLTLEEMLLILKAIISEIRLKSIRNDRNSPF